MRTFWNGLVSITLALGTLTIPVGLGAARADGPGIIANGRVNVTDIDGGYFENAAQFAITAAVRPDGTAFGRLNLSANGDFGSAWGACPFDPRCEDFPNLTTNTFQLNGLVSTITSFGDTLEISGTLTEEDHGKGAGVIFFEEDVPFVITASEGSTSFVFQFCEVPAFTMDMAAGTLSVRAGAPSPGLLNRPAARPSALPCR